MYYANQICLPDHSMLLGGGIYFASYSEFEDHILITAIFLYSLSVKTQAIKL